MDWIWISVIITSFHIYIFSYSHLSKVRVKRACNSVKLHSPSQTFWGTMREKVWERESTDPFLEVSICKASKSPHIAFYLHTTFRLSLSLAYSLLCAILSSSLSYFIFFFFFLQALEAFFSIVKHAENEITHPHFKTRVPPFLPKQHPVDSSPSMHYLADTDTKRANFWRERERDRERRAKQEKKKKNCLLAFFLFLSLQFKNQF